MNIYNRNCVYFSGSAQLPLGIPSGMMYEIINVGLMIDTLTGEVVDVSTTLLSEGATRFLKSLIIGFNLHEKDITKLIDKINAKYFGDSQKAICVAIRRANEKYQKLRNNEGKFIPLENYKKEKHNKN